MVATPFKAAWVMTIPNKGKLTDDQVKFINAWRGHVHIVRTVDEAMQLVGVVE